MRRMDHALVVPLLSAEEAQDVDRAAIRMASGRLMAASRPADLARVHREHRVLRHPDRRDLEDRRRLEVKRQK